MVESLTEAHDFTICERECVCTVVVSMQYWVLCVEDGVQLELVVEPFSLLTCKH